MISIFTFILWIAAAFQGLPGQAPAAQGQAGGARPPQIRTSISGITVPIDSTDPIPYVGLRLTPIDDPSSVSTPQTGRGGINPTGNYQVTSDALGQFQFLNIAPGRYSISAERDGYVREEHIQAGPGQPGQSIIAVTTSQKMEGLVVAMTPVPTISGTVYGADTKRLAGASIDAYRVQYTTYGRQLVRAASVLSHEGGDYRLFQLSPGYYYVSARYSNQSLQPWKSLLELSPNLPNPDEGYSTVYFPGEMKIDGAKVINLHNTRGFTNADIVFRESRYHKLTINLTPPPVQPLPNIPIGGRQLVNPRVAVFPVGTDLGAALDYRVLGNGKKFSIDRLAEGDYVVMAFADFQDGDGNGYSAAVSDTQLVRVTDNTEITISAMDPIDIPGTLGRGLTPSGWGGIQVQLVRVDPLTNSSIVANIDGAGRFTLPTVGPGLYDVFLKGLTNGYIQAAGFSYSSDRQSMQIRIDSNLPPRTWVCLSSDCQRSRLISDAPLTISYGQMTSTATGTVTSRDGKKAAGAQVVLVPNDPVLRLRKDRYVVVNSDGAGSFKVGIPAGNYTAYAFQSLEPEIYFDRDFNAQMASKGTPVSFAGLSSPPLDLSLISADDVASLTR